MSAPFCYVRVVYGKLLDAAAALAHSPGPNRTCHNDVPGHTNYPNIHTQWSDWDDPKQTRRLMQTMRPPNFKLGWFVPHQIAALTHFHSDVTAEDFMGVIQTGEELLGNVDKAFHVIIDNRFVNMSSPVHLNQMKEMVTYMNHPCLRWVVVVKPVNLALDTSRLPIEQIGETRLKNASSLQEAINYLQTNTSGITWEKVDATFFPDAEVTG